MSSDDSIDYDQGRIRRMERQRAFRQRKKNLKRIAQSNSAHSFQGKVLRTLKRFE